MTMTRQEMIYYKPESFDEYMRAVEDGRYPTEPRVPVGTEFVNENGNIVNMAFGKFGGLALINSKEGSIRSNHYHKTDWHFITVMSGVVHYYWRPAGSSEEPQMEIFRMGETFFTPPMVEHGIYSPRETDIMALSRISRRHADHEADVVRIKLISLDGERIVTHR